MRSGFNTFDPEWLAAEAIRIALIILAGFLLAAVVGGFFGLLGDLIANEIRSVGSFLATVIRYTTLVTALLYVVDRGA